MLTYSNKRYWTFGKKVNDNQRTYNSPNAPGLNADCSTEVVYMYLITTLLNSGFSNNTTALSPLYPTDTLYAKKHLNSPVVTTTGPLFGIISTAMFGTATSVNEVNPTTMENLAYIDLDLSPNNDGKRYQWTLLMYYRKVKATTKSW